MPQKAYLFSGTVRSNLAHGAPDADDAAMWAALEIAQARDFVEALPEGLDAPVAQGGTNFSGGQRQRLAIARAVVRRPGIYLFDDSFSALDLATDARLRAEFAAKDALFDARWEAARSAYAAWIAEHGLFARLRRAIGRGPAPATTVSMK